MYRGLISPPDNPGAHFGVLFWHKDGFSTACRHSPIALGQWAVKAGLVTVIPLSSVDVVIDVPSGWVDAKVYFDDKGMPVGVNVNNVVSFQIATGVKIDLMERTITVDIGFGGAVYACVNVGQLGLHIETSEHNWFVALGRKIKADLGSKASFGEYNCYGVLFFETLANLDNIIKQKNVVIFADGQLDRSPCVSGTATHVAMLHAIGSLPIGKKLVHKSIIGTRFEAYPF